MSEKVFVSAGAIVGTITWELAEESSIAELLRDPQLREEVRAQIELYMHVLGGALLSGKLGVEFLGNLRHQMKHLAKRHLEILRTEENKPAITH